MADYTEEAEELRELTDNQYSMEHCLKALQLTEGDQDEALDYLMEHADDMEVDDQGSKPQ